MSSPSSSHKFRALYNTLPVDAQKQLLEHHLLPLIDDISLIERMKLTVAMNDAQTRLKRAPKLNLADKKAEVEVLFEEYRRDSYRPKNTSRREEISEEIVDSITSWLSDIWQTVYEFAVDFETAHQCLKFSCEALYRLSTTGNGCKCSFMNMYLPVSIKNSHNTVIKHFSFPGAFLLEDAFLWIWRDMLLRMLASRETRHIEAIPVILKDIQSTTAEWGTSLDRLLVAGGKVLPNGPDDEDSELEDESEDDDDTQCPAHAVHWPESLLEYLPTLRTHICATLLDTFTLTPSLQLYNTITSISPFTTMSPLASSLLNLYLKDEIHYNPAAAATALEIYAWNDDHEAIMHTLEVARPILRHRDGVAVRVSVRALGRHAKYEAFAMEFIKRELGDCLETLRTMVVNYAFGDIEKAESQILLTEATLLRSESQTRKDAIDRWANAVLTNNWEDTSFSFAALLMEFPGGISPYDIQDSDPFLFTELKEDSPEYEDLRDEWRPRLKERFEGWVSLAGSLKSAGLSVLEEIENKMNETMPYLAYRDVAEEMIGRIQDKPHCYHICDALDGMSQFMQTQKAKAIAKLHVATKKAQRKNHSAQQSINTSLNNAGPSDSGSSIFGMNFNFSMPGLEALD